MTSSKNIVPPAAELMSDWKLRQEKALEELRQSLEDGELPEDVRERLSRLESTEDETEFLYLLVEELLSKCRLKASRLPFNRFYYPKKKWPGSDVPASVLKVHARIP